MVLQIQLEQGIYHQMYIIRRNVWRQLNWNVDKTNATC